MNENLDDKEIKKIKSIEKRMNKINKEIQEMGFNVYLTNNKVNIMIGDSHSCDGKPLYNNVMHSFVLNGWDGGDW